MLFDLEKGRLVGELLSDGWFVDALEVDELSISVDAVECRDAITKALDFV